MPSGQLDQISRMVECSSVGDLPRGRGSGAGISRTPAERADQGTRTIVSAGADGVARDTGSLAIAEGLVS